LPGIWAGVGGHLEPEEINNPETACLREIYEETGLTNSQLSDLRLKYILLRQSKDEIRVQYVYFAKTTTRQVKPSEEGDLYWINRDELFERDFSATTVFVLKHYLVYEDSITEVLVGTVSEEHNKPVINWATLKDWES
jgi:8-oxo-dGTP diphosphatase